MAKKNKQALIASPDPDFNSVYVAAYDKKLDYGKKYSKITPKSNITLESFSKVLMDAQSWSQQKSLLQYCAYYSHYDNMLSGALYNIFVPFSQGKYRLSGGETKINKFFKDWLEMINFSDILEGMAFDYYTYGRFVAYLYDNGVLQLLPVFRSSIESLDIKGNPVIAYEIEKSSERPNIDMSSLEKHYEGYPPEIIIAIKDKKSYAMLKPQNTFSCSMPKSSWEKYAIPMIASTFPYVIKKEMLAETEQVELDNMSKSILEVQVGDKEKIPKPSMAELQTAGRSYVNALKSDGANVACVAWNVKAQWLTYTNKECLESIVTSVSFQNWNILAALSISPVLSAGSEHFGKGSAGSYSQTSAAIDTINKRINNFLRKVAVVMNRVFRLIAEQNGFSTDKLPRFIFDKTNLINDGRLSEELMKLYDRGLVSNKTLYSYTDLDYTTEKKQRQTENNANETTIFMPRPTANQMSYSGAGAPVKDDTERITDKEQSLKNSNPSPSDN